MNSFLSILCDNKIYINLDSSFHLASVLGEQDVLDKATSNLAITDIRVKERMGRMVKSIFNPSVLLKETYENFSLLNDTLFVGKTRMGNTAIPNSSSTIPSLRYRIEDFDKEIIKISFLLEIKDLQDSLRLDNSLMKINIQNGKLEGTQKISRENLVLVSSNSEWNLTGAMQDNYMYEAPFKMKTVSTIKKH